jgi:hypothetical protein
MLLATCKSHEFSIIIFNEMDIVQTCDFWLYGLHKRFPWDFARVPWHLFSSGTIWFDRFSTKVKWKRMFRGDWKKEIQLKILRYDKMKEHGAQNLRIIQFTMNDRNDLWRESLYLWEFNIWTETGSPLAKVFVIVKCSLLWSFVATRAILRTFLIHLIAIQSKINRPIITIFITL